MDNFQVGNTVELKSGGPVMTIVDIERIEMSALCTWFNQRGVEDHQKFPLAALKPYEEEVSNGTIRLGRMTGRRR
jgi:uncharacterized protein YodC (DUF2158 family)